jgi:hypothetical protein
MMTKLIERLASRWGFYREPPIMIMPTELIVFSSEVDSRRAGFVGQRHPVYSHLRAWWPALGVRGLAIRSVQRITIARDMLFHKTSEGRLVDLLRARQAAFGDQSTWVQL